MTRIHEQVERNYWNKDMSDSAFERRKKRAYYHELASLATGGDRKQTKKVARILAAEDRREVKAPTYMGMTDDELDKFVDDLMWKK